MSVNCHDKMINYPSSISICIKEEIDLMTFVPSKNMKRWWCIVLVLCPHQHSIFTIICINVITLITKDQDAGPSILLSQHCQSNRIYSACASTVICCR